MLKKSYFIIPLIIAISVAGGVFLGYKINKGVASDDGYSSSNIESLMSNFPPIGLKYSTIFSLVESSYVDVVNIDSIAEEMIPEILKELDPHSVYIPAKDVSLQNADLEGKFDGVGVTFNMITDTILIQSVIQGGPSEKVGILGGDRIVTIDEKNVAGIKFPQDSVLTMLRGVRGTKVNLGIERRGLDSMMNITVTRDKIVVKSLDAAFMLTPTTGYIKLLRFARTTHEETLVALAQLKSLGMEHLILDLTDNRGGYLDQAIEIANEFLSKDKLIVTTQRRGKVLAKQLANGRGNFVDQDVIVLLNESSASSSEIVAGALQDNDAATIVGRRSFGKGLVQQQIPMSDGSMLNLTMARYHTPTGRCIQKPYTDSNEEYNMDYVNRIIHGELVNRDSIHLDSTLRYSTPAGKIVYGGGGIMPEIFVPVDTAKYSDTERKMLMSLFVARFSNRYIDNNRKAIEAANTYEKLEEFFKQNDGEMYNAYVDYINENGAKITPKEAREARKRIELVLKAYVGRYTNEGDNIFYRYILEDDDIVNRALEYIEKGE